MDSVNTDYTPSMSQTGLPGCRLTPVSSSSRRTDQRGVPASVVFHYAECHCPCAWTHGRPECVPTQLKTGGPPAFRSDPKSSSPGSPLRVLRALLDTEKQQGRDV